MFEFITIARILFSLLFSLIFLYVFQFITEVGKKNVLYHLVYIFLMENYLVVY